MSRFIYTLFLGIVICLNVADAAVWVCRNDDQEKCCVNPTCENRVNEEGACHTDSNNEIQCCGECTNKQTCEWYQVWDEDNCECACSKEEPLNDEGEGVCPDGVEWDTQTCACACGDTSEDESACQALKDEGRFYYWDEKTCSCDCRVPIGNIPPDKSWSSAECRWVCKGDGEGELSNACLERNGSGVRDLSHPAWSWDKEDCACKCIGTCPSGYEFDESSCSCNLITPEISGVCASDEVLCELKMDVIDVSVSQWCCRSDQQCGNMPNHCVEISTTPGEISTTPDVISTTPDVISTSPDVISTSPDVISTTPDVISTTPGESTSPGVISTTPGVRAPVRV